MLQASLFIGKTSLLVHELIQVDRTRVREALSFATSVMQSCEVKRNDFGRGYDDVVPELQAKTGNEIVCF